MRVAGPLLKGCVLSGLLISAAAFALASSGCKKEEPAPAVVPPKPPDTRPVVKKPDSPKESPPPPPFAYVDVVRANLPAYPATQPLVVPVDLPQAAHLVLTSPIYLDSRLLLWVTHPQARPTAETLGKPNPEAEYVVPDRVLFVHWTTDDKERITPRVVTPRGDGFEYVTARGTRPIPGSRPWIWSRARPWGNSFLVPTPTGVSIFRVPDDTKPITESYQDLTGGSAASVTSPVPAPIPQLLFDGQGFLAWLPTENGRVGGEGAARYVDDRWLPLGPQQGWPQRIMHLIPLVGGSVIQFVPTENGNVKLNVAALQSQPLDRKAIERLVIELAAGAQAVRGRAFNELTRYGPSIRPILQELLEDQPPEAQARMRQLLAGQVKPLLGPMSLVGDELQVVSRHKDGGAVFYAEAGVSIADSDGETRIQAPAWLAVRPGRAVRLLPPIMTFELTPDKSQIIAVESHDDDWIVVSDARGPRRFLGNDFVKLLRWDEAAYSQLVGVDRRGRWLFRKPGNDDETLVLDPTLPDATPRLPVWNYTNADEVGWDKENWPAVKQSGIRSRLKDQGWVGLEENEQIITAVDTKTAERMSKPPSTSPATQPAQPEISEPLILAAKDGTRYYDGVDNLIAIDPKGEETFWPLPPLAAGKFPVHLVQTEDGRLYLFNQPGRVLRIKPTPEGPEPFMVEATFTRNIPSIDEPTRVWLDPAGRIIVAYENELAILFPKGIIPPKIKQLMLNPGDDEEQRDL